MKIASPKITFLLSILLAGAAQGAQAFCGPYFAEYRVVTSGEGNYGVRCVAKTVNGVIWYGEGAWNNQTYRHVGYVDGPDEGSLENGRMRDIFGNGENFKGSFDGIRVVLSESHDNNGIPTTIRLIGPQREAWKLIDSTTPAYVSNLRAIRTCGPFMRTYRVNVDGDGNYGMRCVIESSHSAPLIFVGEGAWNRQKYMHLGHASSPNRATAGDICRPGTSFCGSTGQDGLTFATRAPGRLVVSGTWNEEWSLVE